jgi:hypothetical protein
MTTGLFGQLTEAIDEARGRFYGVTVGTVINLADPMMLGRVQVQLSFIDDLDLSPWARVAVPMAGIAHGSYFIPNIGDEVLVVFEQGDAQVPYIIGSLWNAMAPPPFPSPIPQVRTLRTLVGNQIVFSEVPPTITIQSGPTPPATIPAPPTPAGPPTIIMSPAGIQIIFGKSVINMTEQGIDIIGTPNLNLTATGVINITGSSVNITSSSATSILAGGNCSMTAPTIKIN